MLAPPQILDRLASWLKPHLPTESTNLLVRFDPYDDRTHLLLMVACETAILMDHSSVILVIEPEHEAHEFIVWAMQTYSDVLLLERLSTEEHKAQLTLKQAYANYASMMLDEQTVPNVTTFLAMMDEVRAQALNAVQLCARDRDAAVLREEESSFVYAYAPLESLHVREISSILAHFGFVYENCYTRSFLTSLPDVDFFVEMETLWDFTQAGESFDEALSTLQEARRLQFTQDEKDILAYYYEYTQTSDKQQALYTRTPSRTLILKEVLT